MLLVVSRDVTLHEQLQGFWQRPWRWTLTLTLDVVHVGPRNWFSLASFRRTPQADRPFGRCCDWYFIVDRHYGGDCKFCFFYRKFKNISKCLKFFLIPKKFWLKVVYVLYKRAQHAGLRPLNFDNPVYRKTTTDGWDDQDDDDRLQYHPNFNAPPTVRKTFEILQNLIN